MLPPHVVVIYDRTTLAPRRVIVQDDSEDGTAAFDGTLARNAMPGEDFAVVQKDQVRGLSLEAIASFAIIGKTGRNPPSMDEVHAADAQARALSGG